MIAFLIGLALAGAAPPAASAPAAPAAAAVDSDQATVDRAADLIGAGKPAEAIALLDPLISAKDQARRGDARQVYCARSPAETLLYGLQAAKDKKAAIIVASPYCYGIFLKGFALIDLNRSDEAKPLLERAVALAPSNAHFLGELAEWYKSKRDFDTAWSLFQRASEASEVSPANQQNFDKRRAMRGLGYILIERGKLDEAEKIYRDCLKMDPTDERAKGQLDYIADQRAKKI